MRDEIKSGSEDGNLISGLIKEGKIVPSHITVGLLKKTMEKMGWNKNFLIDGFPRNKENNDVWNELMNSLVDF